METPHVMRIASCGDVMREIGPRWSMVYGVSYQPPADRAPHTATYDVGYPLVSHTTRGLVPASHTPQAGALVGQ
jgi:hypothetical protein